MTLQQMSAVKRWHASHHRLHSMEGQAWDLVLTCWLMGCMGLAPALLLLGPLGLPLCAALMLTPTLYVQARRRLHRRGRLRCDWLDSTRP